MAWSAKFGTNLPFDTYHELSDELRESVNERDDAINQTQDAVLTDALEPFDTVGRIMARVGGRAIKGNLVLGGSFVSGGTVSGIRFNYIDKTDNGGAWDNFSGDYDDIAPHWTDGTLFAATGLSSPFVTYPTYRYDTILSFMNPTKIAMDQHRWTKSGGTIGGGVRPTMSSIEQRPFGTGSGGTDQANWTAAKAIVESAGYTTGTTVLAEQDYQYGTTSVTIGVSHRLKVSIGSIYTGLKKSVLLHAFVHKHGFTNFWPLEFATDARYQEIETFAASTASSFTSTNFLNEVALPSTAPPRGGDVPHNTSNEVTRVEVAGHEFPVFVMKWDVTDGFFYV